MSQECKLYNHLKMYGSITSMEAINEYGITRLAACIASMREAGLNIVSVKEVGDNRDGIRCHWTRYYLRDDLQTEN